MKKIHIFPNAYKALTYNQNKEIEVKIDSIYLDGFGRKIKIDNSVAWKGVIFYVGRYIDPNTGKIIDDMNKNAECKFLKNGQHFLYYGKELNLVEEINGNGL